MTLGRAPAGSLPSEEVGGRIASLFDAHGRMVLGLCRFLLRDAHEADDATQQTFLSAYRSLLRGRVPRKPGAWLAEIARNECRTLIAARMHAPLPLAASVEALGNDPADAADLTEVIDELKAAIAELPDRQREAVVLRDFYGLSYREVATAMTVSVPVVESLLFRARRRLGRQLGTLPRLAQGALTFPVALRDDLALAIPGFDGAAAGVGIAGGGAAAGGMVAKLATMPAAAKVTTATTVAAVAVGGAAVTPQVIERQSKPDKPPASPLEAWPAPKPHAQAASRSTPPREKARVQLVRHEEPNLDREPARRDDAADVEPDDDLDEPRARGRSSEGRETEVTEAEEAETRMRSSGRQERPEPPDTEAESESESEQAEDEETETDDDR